MDISESSHELLVNDVVKNVGYALPAKKMLERKYRVEGSFLLVLTHVLLIQGEWDGKMTLTSSTHQICSHVTRSEGKMSVISAE